MNHKKNLFLFQDESEHRISCFGGAIVQSSGTWHPHQRFDGMIFYFISILQDWKKLSGSKAMEKSYSLVFNDYDNNKLQAY